VLVADEAQHVPPTVRSRCFQLGFAVPEHDVALRWLAASGVPNAELALAQAGGAPLAAVDLQAGDFWPIRGAFLEALAKANVQLGAVLARAPAEHLGELLGQLYRWCYDLISLRTGGRLRYHLDHAKPLAQLAVTADMGKLLAFVRDLEAALRAREHPLNPRLVLERLMVGYLRAVGAEGS
jgi:DNA polymerase-3 subunit delta'